jgi:RNA polymerase sigma-70 factor (ECF subfamily)
MQYEAAAERATSLDRGDAMAREALRDRAAFAAIYARYRDPVYRYLRSRCRTDEDAGDLAGLTFERALDRLATYRGEGAGLAAWLFRIARNLAADHARRDRSMHTVELPVGRADLVTAVTPESEALRRESTNELVARMAELTDVARECLVLRYAGDLTVREIAAVISKSEAATQKQLTRALAHLKKAYRDER